MTPPATLLLYTVAATDIWQSMTGLAEMPSQARIHLGVVAEASMAALPVALILTPAGGIEVSQGMSGGRLILRVFKAQSAPVENALAAMLEEMLYLAAQLLDVSRNGTADKLIVREPVRIAAEPTLRPRRDQETHALMVADLEVEFGVG